MAGKAEVNKHDPMRVTIIKSSILWRGKRTADILVPQTNYPKINVQVDDGTLMVYLYDNKLRNVTCGRTLKSMLPCDVFDIILPKLSKNSGYLFDGERYFVRSTGTRASFEEVS